MNIKIFAVIILSLYLSLVSGQFQYLQLYSYYRYPNEYEYPSYSVPYYSTYVIPTYYSSYYANHQGLQNSTNTTVINSNRNVSIVQQSSSIMTNVLSHLNIYTIIFMGMILQNLG